MRLTWRSTIGLTVTAGVIALLAYPWQVRVEGPAMMTSDNFAPDFHTQRRTDSGHSRSPRR